MGNKALSTSTPEGIVEALKDLETHPGFKYLCSVMQQRVDELQMRLLSDPLESADAAYKQEFEKGYLQGILYPVQTMATLIQTNQYEIRQRNEDNGD